MTRAFVYFFKGKFAESFMYHPFVPYVIVVYVWFMVRTFLKKHFASLNLGNSKIIYLIYIGIAIIFVQWFVKLYIRFVF